MEKHCRQVAELTLQVVYHLNLSKKQWVQVAIAAYLHDLGKTTWPAELHAKFPLATHDWALIKAHPIASANIAKEIWPEIPEEIVKLVRAHHERPGGTGYPDGLNEPGIETLIIAGCDVYSATTTHRPYRIIHSGQEDSHREALMQISRFAPANLVAAISIATCQSPYKLEHRRVI